MRKTEASPGNQIGSTGLAAPTPLPSFQRGCAGQEESLGKASGKDQNVIIHSKPYAVSTQ